MIKPEEKNSLERTTLVFVIAAINLVKLSLIDSLRLVVSKISGDAEGAFSGD